MENIQLCEFDEDGLQFPVQPTLFGQHAFWLHTPDKDLTEQDDIDLRLLMRQMKRYSVNHQLCKQLRKTDSISDDLIEVKHWIAYDHSGRGHNGGVKSEKNY